tara:strand:+ start:7423 stop:8655 length:1233 start_codon:yes stop_codon:yes gene_type:complete
MNSKLKINILKRIFLIYISISIPTNFFIKNLYLRKFAPSTSSGGDFISYLVRDFNISKWNPNYGFSLFIRFFRIEDINQIKSIILAKSVTTFGVMLIIISILNVLEHSKYSQRKIKEILYLFTILIAINPYYSIAGIKLSTQSFIYLGIGSIYLLSSKIIFFSKKLSIQNKDFLKKIDHSELNKNLIIFIIFLLICSIRNILLILISSLIFLFFKKINIKNLFDLKNISSIRSQLNWLNILFLVLASIIFIFDLYLFIGYIEPYLSSRGNIFSSELDLGFFRNLINALSRLPLKIIHILGIRESATIHSNYLISVNPNKGNIVSNNIFLTNILPVIFYIPFNSLGLIFIFKSKIFKFMFWIILPCIFISLLGATHMRYLYPLVPAITLGWSLYLVNKDIPWLKNFSNQYL